jgi:hypothetical protein
MANIKDFIKKIGNETVSLEEQQKALAAVEQTIVEAKAKREESIGKNVDLVISALKKIESDLEAKLVELNNTPAKQGVAGPKGEKGRDGRDGKDGYKGQDGKDGIDGQDGKDGEDGVSVTDAKVDFDGSLVITLSDGREIDAGTVLSVDAAKHIHSVQTGGTGSTSQAVLDAIAAIQATLATYGTMATQNANAVAITGGNINNTVIGGTTPAAGTFTTITGQTEVLKGTGENLLTYSQSFTSNWIFASGTFTTNTATDPLGGSTAATLTMSGATTANFFTNVTVVNGLTYTWSIYAKAGTSSTVQLICYATGGIYQVNCNLSTGTISSTSGTGTSTITSAGNGWYRITGTATATTAGTGYLQLNVVGNASTCYVWGGQLEVGSTANAFVATTSAAIYGTPTLSFSGVAGLGLESNGSLYVSPAGTGAIQAQATTSSTVGGNARGTYAVDWQTNRNAANQVASGDYSVVIGGLRNKSTGTASMSGGYTNTASGYNSGVFTGYTNTAGSGNYAVIFGGTNNTASGAYSAITSGNLNTAGGYYNFIGNGFTNSGTANAAVTTQSGTMNGTTAVTLSGSNASIKVGQYITGTSIAADTYVAAISGTSLTLSQNASGSSTSTLSFYTPHGVVVGGGNNQATGSYSFIGGGGDAGTSGNRNVASGDWSFVGGGRANLASGEGSIVVGGGEYLGGANGNQSTSYFSTIVGGIGNRATNTGASVLGGYTNTADGAYSTVFGFNALARGIQNNFVIASRNSGSISGGSQTSILPLSAATTDATPTVLVSNSSAASGTNQVILPNNSAYFFRGEVISGVTGGGDTKGWTIEGVIKRGAGVGTTALVGTPTVTSMYADLGAATWAIAVTADTTNGGLRVTFTGQASTTIRTVCRINTVEMTY